MANITKAIFADDIVNMLNRGLPIGSTASLITDYVWDLFVTQAGATVSTSNRNTAANNVKPKLTGQG